MRIAVIDKKKCQPKKCGYICEKVCPGVRMGDETITHEDTNIPVISEELCTGCGICVKKCPYNAISIVNLPEELERPVHQYGVNGFRLFGLPVPKEGVVGIIGPNGIGKTTALRILSGQLVPNLGKEHADWDEIIEYHRGKEIQKHLEKISKGEIVVSIKPQNVDLIPKHFDGTVEELLKKTNDIGNIELLVEKLELGGILKRRLDEISGGELQRVAIAVALGKDAQLYFFDEPTSYLDVKQRLVTAKIIREIVERGSVLVVEHDLAVLDYLSDNIHVVYGKEGVYGIVSGLKGVRVGINEFLDGYLKAENMRFRDHSIKFEVKPPADEWKGESLITFPHFRKTYESFVLDVSEGEIRKGEVIGILGPNAIGKSTFMKVLAGVEKPDDVSLSMKIKIAYKPQYLTSNFEGSVEEFIDSVDINREIFDTYLKNDLVALYPKQVQELSGGELQRVAIAITMAKECDLCLLDEPSAFLDVEQRLRFADLIRKITEKTERSTIVIDHDITLQDYISDRLMVFDGIPGKRGLAHAPESMESGMNKFLKIMDITYRRDPETGRPRANKPGSQKDMEQKKSGKYYYV
ncbi:MAG: ribosome biogenesis/translation initiation ATPase RLI [Candidatus Diapherotrites archaeon]|nr:ribosome biogenesis/translation initiation ATPase RLI [Candidatus Diapherotrites archaeon]